MYHYLFTFIGVSAAFNSEGFVSHFLLRKRRGEVLGEKVKVFSKPAISAMATDIDS
jgi:hypothetical protein